MGDRIDAPPATPTETTPDGVETVSIETLRHLVHDLRNPLVAAFGFLALLERAQGGPEATRHVASLRESIEALRAVLDRARALYGKGTSH